MSQPLEHMDAFDPSASACRCLLELAHLKNISISDEEFIARYRPQYPIWERRVGITDTAMVCDIARDLFDAKSVQVIRNYERALQAFSHSSSVGALVFTEVLRTPGQQLLQSYDCSLALDMTSTSFELWRPDTTGRATVERYPAADWEAFSAYALIIA